MRNKKSNKDFQDLQKKRTYEKTLAQPMKRPCPPQNA